MEELGIPDIYTQVEINKSVPVKQDSDGNYIFEVEASNENLDLQNQITLQSALMKSKEFFLKDGVISDDHQHKRRLDDGTVESDKTKIIGEPISVRTEGKRTFVKGKLFSTVKAAKPFIDLLKAGSSLVKASIGGIQPKIRKNADGTETVTSFLWNDLALTCSPVNWTVQGACFAKSLNNAEFCKALVAGTGSDASTYTGGRALQGEDLEKKTKNILPEELATSKELEKDEEDPEKNVEKSMEDIIRSCVVSIDNGELKTQKSILDFLEGNGFDKSLARETLREIINEGGRKMIQSHFSDTVQELLKSCNKEVEKAQDEEDVTDDEIVLDENKDEKKDDENKDADKEGEDVEKSFDGSEFSEEETIDVTDVIKSMAEQLDTLTTRVNELEGINSDMQKSILDVATVVQNFGNQPEQPKSIMQKSVMANVNAPKAGGYIQPTKADFDIFKEALCKSFKEGDMTLEKSAHLESVFQKAVMGKKMNENDEREIRSIYSKFGNK